GRTASYQARFEGEPSARFSSANLSKGRFATVSGYCSIRRAASCLSSRLKPVLKTNSPACNAEKLPAYWSAQAVSPLKNQAGDTETASFRPLSAGPTAASFCKIIKQVVPASPT